MTSFGLFPLMVVTLCVTAVFLTRGRSLSLLRLCCVVGLDRGLQPSLHLDLSTVPKVRLREIHHFAVVRADQTGRHHGIARKTLVRPGKSFVSQLLDPRAHEPISPARQQEQKYFHQRHFQHDRHQNRRPHFDITVARHDQGTSFHTVQFDLSQRERKNGFPLSECT